MADGQHRLFARPDAPHRVHDLLLVAAWAAGDADDLDRARAQDLVDACQECAALAADLRSIQAATSSLPAATRPRDFRLTASDAQRLRPKGVRAVFAVVAGRRLERAQPIAAGLTMLGLTGLLVSSISFGAGGPGAAAPTGADAPAPAGAGDMHGTQLQAESGAPAGAGGGASAAPEIGTTGDEPRPSGGEGDSAPRESAETAGGDASAAEGARLPIAVGSAAAVAAGVGLFVAARRQRRRYG